MDKEKDEFFYESTMCSKEFSENYKIIEFLGKVKLI